MKVVFGDVLRQHTGTERITNTANETFVTLRLNGKGAIRRNVGEGKTPQPFTGYRVKSGQFIYSRIDARNGAFAIIPENLDGAVVSKDFPVFEIDKSTVDPRFLLLSVSNEPFVDGIRTLSFGATNRQRVKEDVFLNLPLGLPPLDEQRRIAAILDKADELRAKRREALAHLEALTQSIFQDMEHQAGAMPRVKLSEVCVRIQTGPFGSLLHKEDYVAGGIPLVNPMHIRDGKIFADPSFSVSALKFDQLNNYRLMPGDVVLGRRGELGRCAEVLDSHGPMLCGTGSLIVRPSAGLMSSTYLSAVLSSRSVKNRLSEVAQGATMLNLNTKIVGSLEIPLPPLELQQTFATQVAAVERLKETHRKHLAELDALFASLQHRAFKGEL